MLDWRTRVNLMGKISAQLPVNSGILDSSSKNGKSMLLQLFHVSG